MEIQPSEIRVGNRVRITVGHYARDGRLGGVEISEGTVSGLRDSLEPGFPEVHFAGPVRGVSTVGTPVRRVTVDRLSQPLPEGLGSKIRAKMRGAGPYTFVRADTDDAPWYTSERPSTDEGWAGSDELTEVEILHEAP